MSLFQRLFGRPDDGDTDRDYQLQLIREADAHIVRQHYLRDAETYLHQQRDNQDTIDEQRRDNDAYDDHRRRDSYRDYDSRDRNYW